MYILSAGKGCIKLEKNRKSPNFHLCSPTDCMLSLSPSTVFFSSQYVSAELHNIISLVSKVLHWYFICFQLGCTLFFTVWYFLPDWAIRENTRSQSEDKEENYSLHSNTSRSQCLWHTMVELSCFPLQVIPVENASPSCTSPAQQFVLL